MSRHRGRPHSAWIGKFGTFAERYTVIRLARDLEIDLNQVYRWVRGDSTPAPTRAIQVVEIARGAGAELSLEDVYQSDIVRVRVRMRSRSSLPPR
jgi:transposase-like protein